MFWGDPGSRIESPTLGGRLARYFSTGEPPSDLTLGGNWMYEVFQVFTAGSHMHGSGDSMGHFDGALDYLGLNANAESPSYRAR